MSQPRNPFVYGPPVVPSQFVGRQSEIKKIFDQLHNPALGSVALSGERRIGKTSLLHYLAAPHVARQHDLDWRAIFIFQDCAQIVPFSPTNFWQAILKRLERKLKRKEVEQKILAGIQATLAQPQIGAADIEYILDDLHEAGFLLVLLLDEFEACVHTDVSNEATTRQFLGGLRSLVNYVPRTLSLIAATHQLLSTICRPISFMGSPFYNNFVFISLRHFQTAEAELLWGQTLTDTSVIFSKIEQAQIYDLAGTHPMLLQAAAALMFERKLTNPNQTQDFLSLRQQFREAVVHQFEDLWYWSSTREREILTTLAHGEERSEIATWTDEWEQLVRRGLLKREEGTYRLFSSVFWEWLIDNLYRLSEKHSSLNPELDDLKQQVVAHRRRLHILQDKEVRFGALHVPEYIPLEIEDIKVKIEALEAEIGAEQG